MRKIITVPASSNTSSIYCGSSRACIVPRFAPRSAPKNRLRPSIAPRFPPGVVRKRRLIGLLLPSTDLGAKSPGADETVEYFLAAGMLEVDLELVAFDRRDGAVAELAVKHPLAERQIVAALVAEADGRGAGLDDALW